jgi:hypothetical protein
MVPISGGGAIWLSLRDGHCVVATPILGDLHHEYCLESRAA